METAVFFLIGSLNEKCFNDYSLIAYGMDGLLFRVRGLNSVTKLTLLTFLLFPGNVSIKTLFQSIKNAG